MIKQAVILAGGRGERLRPITDTIPKPMVSVNGRPFLEYLVEYLKKQGIEEIVMLLGYLPEKITEHFKDGQKFGVKIKYEITPVADESGTRLLKAKNILAEEFLLLYCDNYCPINLQRLYEAHRNKNVLATVSIFSNLDNYTKNNLQVADGLVQKYDAARQDHDLNGVDVGYIVMSKKTLDLAPGKNFSINEIFPELATQNRLGGFVTNYPYASISTPDRLPAAAEYLTPRKVIFLDRDGTINVRPPQGGYVTEFKDFTFLPGVKEAMRLLSENRYEIYLITNQSGVGRGVMTAEALGDIHKNMSRVLENEGAKVDGIYACPHDWSGTCPCRKPKIGLFLEAARDHAINLAETVFIGDDTRDLEAGNNAGIKTYLVDDNHNLFSIVKEKILS